MAGLYVHIPFCASRCIYCGFYSTTLPALITDYLSATGREMQLRKHYLDEPVSTIYLGGGTPSQLSPHQTEQIFCDIDRTWGLAHAEEVTMECNPDDVTEEYAAQVATLPINRISLGIQTFSDERLRFLHRRHDTRQARRAVELLRKAGFDNISIDLMFGFPGETLNEWRDDIRQALQLDVEHISAYSLMYEEGTALFRMLETGKIDELDDEISKNMYELLVGELEQNGYEHYEISNFAKPDYRSRHNSSYWKGIPYIGIGAAAHSYDRTSRQWNVADIQQYIRGINDGSCVFEREELDLRTRYNDMITTALRTCEGISMPLVRNDFGENYARYLLKSAEKSIVQHLLTLEDDHLRLTREGVFVSNDVMSDLIALTTP